MKRHVKAGLVALAAGGMVAAGGAAQAQFAQPFVMTQSVQAITGAISTAISQVVDAQLQIDPAQVEPIGSVAVEPKNGQRMVATFDNGDIGFWDLERGTEVKRLSAHPGGLRAFVIGSDLAVSIGKDGTAVAWAPRTSARLADIEVPAPARVAAVGREGKVAVLGLADRTLRLWTPETAGTTTLATLDAEPAALMLSADGTWLVAADTAGQIRTWNLADKTSRTFTLGQAPTAVFVHNHGQVVMAVLGDGTVRQIDFGQKTVKTLAAVKETVLAAALSPDGHLLAVAGGDGSTHVVSTQNGAEVKAVALGADLRSLSFASSGDVLLAADSRGVIRVVDIPGGRQSAELIASPKGWVVINADGSFDSAGRGETAVSWAANGKSYAVGQFVDSHFEPGLLSMTLDRAEPVKPIKVSKAFNEPSEIAFVDPAADGVASNEQLSVTVSARDLGDGLDEVRLYHDDREVGVDTSRLGVASPVDDGKPVRFTFRVSLHSGVNQLQAVSVGRSRVASKPVTLKLSYSGEEARPDLHVLTVGINHYRNPALDLNYGVPDAKGVAGFFGGPKGRVGLYGTVTVTEITDTDAVRENILKAIGDLEHSKPDDVVVIYFAGHGDTREERWYFIPHDVTYPERVEQLRDRGLSNDEIYGALQRIPARKVLLVIDACKSGAMVTMKQRGFEERKALVKMARASGTHVVAAAAKEQFATELSDLGHGAFTYVLLEGLSGKAATGSDRAVTVRSLVTYIEDHLPEMSAKGGEQPQFPVVDSRGMDFPIALAMAPAPAVAPAPVAAPATAPKAERKAQTPARKPAP